MNIILMENVIYVGGGKTMKIGIIDADLLGRKKHRFPNLACMKISGYHKDKGDEVTLLTTYDDIDDYDRVYISKVFTDTPIDESILKKKNVKYGGTGFFWDKAPNLPEEIEHHMPDYHLYEDWIQTQLDRGMKIKEYDDYLNSSVGFLTRGCFRKCDFCVNKKYDRAFLASPLEEFFDPSRKRIVLYDDNFLAYPNWQELLEELVKAKKPFSFNQGLDIRLITEEKAQILGKVKYNNKIIFAFDNLEDKKLIESRLKIWRKYSSKQTKLYLLCGFDRNGLYGNKFWKEDIVSVFERLKVTSKYGCLPYITRFNKYEDSPFRGMYINLHRWCNQPNQFKKKTFREFCYDKINTEATRRYADEFEKKYPKTAAKYYDLKYWDLNEY